MENIRCARCGALLFKAQRGALAGAVEIKCRRCAAVNAFRPVEAHNCERRERPQHGETTCGSTSPQK